MTAAEFAAIDPIAAAHVTGMARRGLTGSLAARSSGLVDPYATLDQLAETVAALIPPATTPAPARTAA